MRLTRLVVAVWLVTCEAYASTDTHLDSAFFFADKKQWSEALSHAGSSRQSVVITTIQWMRLLDPDSGATPEEIERFMAAHPGWPQQAKLKMRAEMALVRSNPSDDAVRDWFMRHEPLTGLGKILLARALWEAEHERATALLREGWRDGDMDVAREREALEQFGDTLSEEDHMARTDRLIWEEKYEAAERMLPLLAPPAQRLMHARLALAQDEHDAPELVESIPESERGDTGLIFERMRWRARSGDDIGTRAMLLKAPEQVPFPARWWKFREVQVRKAIDEGDIRAARKLMANHGQREGATLAEALWLQGWLNLVFLEEPSTARDAFAAMAEVVKYPVSKARAYFWLGRAQDALDQKEAAKQSYAQAAAYPTTFYGQMAASVIYHGSPLRLPAAPRLSNEDKKTYAAGDLPRAVKAATEAEAYEVATALIHHLIDEAAGDHEVALAVTLAQSVGKPTVAVRAAKRAMQRGVVMVQAGYPLPKLSAEIAVDAPLALAISRQESEFDREAKSKSGALGLMQLLPSTAREVAKREKMSYSKPRLFEAAYNMKLGTAYLARMINSFDGSYVLAIAAYNAGPGRVRGWVETFGEPHRKIHSVINWIEKIPYEETRTYVQRVLENLQIYRALLAGSTAPGMKIGEDLTR